MTAGTFAALLNADYTISRRMRTHDGQGGWIVTYAELGTVRARLRPASGTEREVASRYGREISHVLYVGHGAEADIRRGDRVTGEGLTVEVLGVREPSQADHHYEIDCLEVQAETSEAGS